jgi:hypothetical protein
MREQAGIPEETFAPPLVAYRAAARRLHPDAGGSREDWDRLEQAAVLLRESGLL